MPLANPDQTRQPNGEFGPAPENTAATIELPEAVTGRDRIHEAILTEYPDATQWTVFTEEWDNGYFFTLPISVQLADGTTVQVDDSDLDDALSELSYEERPGQYEQTFSTASFKAGARAVAFEADDEDESTDWEGEFTNQLRDAHPDLARVILTTEEWDNGFYWSTTGEAYERGETEPSEIDLSDFEDLLIGAASYGDLGRNSYVELSLVDDSVLRNA